MKISTIAAVLVVLCGSGCGAMAKDTVRAGAVFKDCAHCPEMVVIPPGEFDMGFDGGEPDRYEGAVHHVKISAPFALGRYELTTGEYREFVKATGHISGTDCNIATGADVNFVKGRDWQNPGYYGRAAKANDPVVCVNWLDVRAYVDWLAKRTGKPYRLISESEWEYAARAGSYTPYPWGEAADQGCITANIYDRTAAKALKLKVPPADCTDGSAAMAAVGSRKPNPFGLYDIIGNAWEWLEDCYAVPYAADVPVDGKPYEAPGTCERRVVRGGGWSSGTFRDRSSWRGRDKVDLVTYLFGTRIARDLPDGSR